MLAAVRSLWNPDGQADIATRAQPVHIDGAHVSGLFHTTPDEVQNGFRTGEISVGTVNRMMVARIRPAARRAATGEYPQDVFDDLVSRIARATLLMEQMDPGEAVRIIDYSPEADALWSAEKPRLDDQAEDEIGVEILTRNAGHVARVALLYALIEGHDQIEVADLRAALAVWDVCRHSAMLLFGAMTGDRDADRMYGVLVRHGGAMNRTELRDALGRHGRGSDIEHGLVVLASHGLIRRMKRRTGGRPEERIEVVNLVTDLRDKGAESDLSPADPDL